MVLQSLETLQWEDFEERVVFKILRQLSHVTHSKSLFAPMIKKSSYPLKRRQLQYIYSICYKFCLILHTSYSTYTTVVCVNVLFFFLHTVHVSLYQNFIQTSSRIVLFVFYTLDYCYIVGLIYKKRSKRQLYCRKHPSIHLLFSVSKKIKAAI